jgi:hypothetical protein
MDLHPAVVGIKYVRSDDYYSRSYRWRGDISTCADAVIVAAVRGARRLPWRAAGLIGGDDLGDQLSVLVGHVCRVEQVSFARRKAQIDMDITVVLMDYVSDRPGDPQAPVPHLEPVLVVYVRQRIPGATARSERPRCCTM